MSSKTDKSWHDFLNPDVLRQRLISASVYIAAYEALKDSIVADTRSFFWNGCDVLGDKFDPQYASDVLSRNKSPVYASLDWLKSMDAIDDSDIAAFDRIKKCRNELSHRLLSIIGSEGMPADFENCLAQMFALVRKIGVWWVREVEIPINDDFAGREVDDNEIIPGRQIGLQLLCEIALGDVETSRQRFEEFWRRAGKSVPA